MATEIERKFLVVNEAWRARVSETIEMSQGYLNDLQAVESGDMKSSIRIRLEGDNALLNIKSGERGISRLEFEYPVSVDDARELLKLTVGGIVSKKRHLVEHDGFTWEIDEFAGENEGLIVAEIELPSTDTVFDLPEWVGAEVTDSIRYYNLSLAAHPYSQWSASERGTDLPGEF